MPAEILAATIAPTIACLAAAYLLRGQAGRHTTGMTRPHAPYLNPLTARQRAATRYYAHLDLKDGRTPFVNTVNTGSAS